jgi:hypothetical protein
MGSRTRSSGRSSWTFLSNHGNVLLAIVHNPDATLREVAAMMGLSERAVQRIVADLEAGRYLERVRTGRRNRYKIHPELPLRHPVTAHRDIGSLIELMFNPRTCDGDPASLSAIATAASDQPSVPARSRRSSRDPVFETGSRDES